MFLCINYTLHKMLNLKHNAVKTSKVTDERVNNFYKVFHILVEPLN